MPSGHASHKGSSNKPNINSSGIIDEGADTEVVLEQVVPEDLMPYTTRMDEAVEYPPALERPNSSSNIEGDSQQ